MQLIKYDLKAMLKVLFPLSLICMFLAFTNGLLLTNESINSSIMDIILTLYVVLSATILIVSVFIVGFTIIKHFYTSIFTRQGYLTNTLPVTPNQLVFSKVISAFIIQILMAIVFVFSCYLFLSGWISEFVQIGFLNEFVYEIQKAMKEILNLSNMFTYFIALICSSFYSITVPFLAITIGCQFKNKIIMSFASYWVIENVIVAQITNLLLGTYMDSNFVSIDMLDISSLLQNYESIMMISASISIVISVIAYFATVKIIEKRLDI